MLVICNGAIKSGSTWLYNILRCLHPFEAPGDEYLTLRNPRHPCIRPDRIEDFLNSENYEDRYYLSKNHFDQAWQRDLLASREHVFVFDIERDPRDVVVSHYYHERLRNGYEGEFTDFYWTTGRETASRLSRYHELWRNAGPRAYVASYEKLHREFETEVRRIASVLGTSVSAERAAAIREKTSIAALRKDYEKEPRFQGDKFFRKGTIGDWENHFDARMLRDIERIRRGGIARIDLPKIRYRLSLMLRR